MAHDDAHFADKVLMALACHMAGDFERSAAIFEEIAPTPKEGFEVACGLANIVAEVGAARSSPTASGPLTVELDRLPGADSDPETDAAVQDVCALIAAVGNKDYEGAWLIFDRACCTEGGSGPAFLANLIGVTAAVARDAA